MSLLKLSHIIHARRRELHSHQSGAILLLVLAGILILLLTVMMMFEAGRTTQEKLTTQYAADSAAYSQSAVKARSMNMIAYANTSKRMFYSYWVTYFAAAEALATSTASYCRSCNAFNWYACYRCAIGAFQSAGELINFFIHVLDAMDRARDEISTLNDFQDYMYNITPWWSYAENIFRGTQNGATITAGWPPPRATLPGWAVTLMNAVLTFDAIFNTNFGGSFPSVSGRFDELPVEQASGFLGQLTYCGEFILSLEHLTPAVEHVLQSDGGGWDPLGISTDSQTLGHFLGQIMNPLNCIPAFLITGDDTLDWRVTSSDEDEWMQDTSNITLAYFNSDHSQRRSDANYDTILQDHAETPLYSSDGTWAMARSEILWSDTGTASSLFNQIFGNMGVLGGLVNGLSNITAGPLVAIRGGPNMWQPRYTNRLRPLYLPDEDLGTTIDGDPMGLGTVALDSIPYLAVSTTLATLIQGNFDFNTAVDDLYYLYVSTSGYTSNDLEGLPK